MKIFTPKPKPKPGPDAERSNQKDQKVTLVGPNAAAVAAARAALEIFDVTLAEALQNFSPADSDPSGSGQTNGALAPREVKNTMAIFFIFEGE